MTQPAMSLLQFSGKASEALIGRSSVQFLLGALPFFSPTTPVSVTEYIIYHLIKSPQLKFTLSNSPFYSCVLGCQAFNRNEAKGDLVMIQTLLLFKCKLLCYHANQILVSITTRSLSASLQIKGLQYTTVKWPIPPYSIITLLSRKPMKKEKKNNLVIMV